MRRLSARTSRCRSGEIRHLKWDWEVAVPEVADSVLIIADDFAHPSIFHALYKDSLTPDEMHRLEVYLIQLVRMREHQWLQFRDGLLDERTWKAYLKGLAGNLSLPRSRECWKRACNRYFHEAFIDVVDEYLLGIPVEQGYRSIFEEIQDASKQETMT